MRVTVISVLSAVVLAMVPAAVASAGGSLSVQVTSPRTAVVGEPFFATVTVKGGTGPFWYSISGDSALTTSDDGVVTGSVSFLGRRDLVVSVHDRATDRSASARFSVTGRLGGGQLGMRVVYQDGPDIVIEGPQVSQSRRVRLPSNTTLGPVAANAEIAIVSTLDDPEGLERMWAIDLQTGETIRGSEGCVAVSPRGTSLYCQSFETDKPTKLWMVSVRDGTRTPLPKGGMTGWWSERQVLLGSYEPVWPGTDSGTIVVRSAPFGQGGHRSPIHAVLGPTGWMIGITRSNVIVSRTEDSLWLSSKGATGGLKAQTTEPADCLAERTSPLLVCWPGPFVYGDDAVHSRPTSLVQVIDATTGHVLRTVRRSDCWLVPRRFLDQRRVLADCLPATTSALGWSTQPPGYDTYWIADGPSAATAVMDVSTGTWTDIPTIPRGLAIMP